MRAGEQGKPRHDDRNQRKHKRVPSAPRRPHQGMDARRGTRLRLHRLREWPTHRRRSRQRVRGQAGRSRPGPSRASVAGWLVGLQIRYLCGDFRRGVRPRRRVLHDDGIRSAPGDRDCVRALPPRRRRALLSRLCTREFPAPVRIAAATTVPGVRCAISNGCGIPIRQTLCISRGSQCLPSVRVTAGVSVEHGRHAEGVCARAVWNRWLSDAGLSGR